MAGTQLYSWLPLIAVELEPRTLDAVTELAERIADDAKNRVPVDTGALRDAIHVESDEKAVRVVAGDTEAYYGHIVENGSVKMAAHPFLLPAYETEVTNLANLVREHLEGIADG